MKGSQHSDAVLCTECATYALKQVETTNTLLLAQSLQVPQWSIVHVWQGYEISGKKKTAF